MRSLLATLRSWFARKPRTWIYDSMDECVRHLLATKTTTMCGQPTISPCTAEYASDVVVDCPRCPMGLVKAGAR
jgi:hypothetical protein